MEWTCPRCGRSGIIGDFCETCNTLRPPISYSNTNQVPEPTPSPMPEPTPGPLPEPTPGPLPEPSRVLRFEEWSNADGSKTIIDHENHYTINYTEADGYIAYDEAGNEVYHITNWGFTTIKIKNGDSVICNKQLKIEDMNPKMKVTDQYGMEYSISNGYLIEGIEYNEDGSIHYTETYDKDGNICRKFDIGVIEYLDKSKYLYKEIDSDGTINVHGISGNHAFWKLNLDGTYSEYNDNSRRYEIVGTYICDENGNYILKNNDGSVLYTDFYGNIAQKVTADGVVYNYNHDKALQSVTKNGKVMYAKIHHIEYDEEAYDNILATLNNIGDSYKSTISSACSDIASSINEFPDKYSGSGIEGVESNTVGHIDLIKSLSEMTNYSLLAYQTCDEDLRDGLFLLVDSLFDDNDKELANSFKNIINSSIEDRDGDKVLEYKANTDFKYLSNNAIVFEIYSDYDNNKWYLNKIGQVLNVEGNDIKINYGGETFNLEFNENGYAIIKDSNGNPLNIFGDYNLDSKQFGGNQGDLSRSYSNRYVIDILQKYFPDSSMEEKVALLNKARDTGCGYTAVTDFVFKQFEGNEKAFYDTFGYPMYGVRKNGDEITVDYNYEPLIMDLYCLINTKSINGVNSIIETIKKGDGCFVSTYKTMTDYLKEQYNVTFNNIPDEIKYYGDNGFSLYNMDGSLYLSDVGGHAMVGVGQDDNGQKIVSTWGKKYIYIPSNNTKDEIYGSVFGIQN